MSEAEHDQGAALADPGDNGADAPTYTEVEQIAMEKGWRPEGEYTGPKENWRPAGEFLKRIPGGREYRSEIKALKSQVDKIAAASAMSMDRLAKEQAEKIEAKYAAAIDKQDPVGAAKAVREMDALTADTLAAKAPNGNVEEDFARENPWYGKDEDATDYAIAISQREAKKGKSVEDQLDAVAKAVRTRFPELFDATAPAPKPPASVAVPGRAVASAKPAIPKVVQDAAASFAKAAVLKFGGDEKQLIKGYIDDYTASLA